MYIYSEKYDKNGAQKESHYSDFCRVVEALQSPLMVMSGPHCIDMTIEYHQIYFPSQDYLYNHVPLIGNPSFERFQGFQEDHHEFYDSITVWLE